MKARYPICLLESTRRYCSRRSRHDLRIVSNHLKYKNCILITPVFNFWELNLLLFISMAENRWKHGKEFFYFGYFCPQTANYCYRFNR